MQRIDYGLLLWRTLGFALFRLLPGASLVYIYSPLLLLALWSLDAAPDPSWLN